VLQADILRTLTAVDSSTGELVPVSAASGLAMIGDHLYVVADDENTLAVFRIGDHGPGTLLPIFDGKLPSDHSARKAAKADLESLAALPPFAGHPHGALLATGSGSRPNRQRGAVVALDAQGAIGGAARQVDLSPLFKPLQERFGQVNIEGTFVSGNELCLLQRGNGAASVNACIRFDREAFSLWLAGAGTALPAQEIRDYELGSISGVPLAFTDGAPLPGGAWVFCAAAEDTTDSYLDGACAGSVVGLVGADGAIRTVQTIATAHKVEGIAAIADAAGATLLMVTDDDERQAPAVLLRARLPIGGGKR
jgi:hypothetical protein